MSISIVTYIEVYEGVLSSVDQRGAQVAFAEFISDVPILPLSLNVANRCAQIRTELRARGRRVHSRALDLINAATALEHELTLVTRNARDYRDIPGLRLYDANPA